MGIRISLLAHINFNYIKKFSIKSIIKTIIYNLYLLNENFTNGYSTIILNLLSFISVFCAVSVIITKNPIISVLFLIGLFLSIASYLITIGISFIGLSYLLVYVGAVSILFLFILMLINIRISELLSDTSNSIPLVFIIAFSLNSILSKLLPQNYLNNDTFNDYLYYLYQPYINIFEEKIYFITINTWDSNLAEINHITSIGNIIYSNYSI